MKLKWIALGGIAVIVAGIGLLSENLGSTLISMGIGVILWAYGVYLDENL